MNKHLVAKWFLATKEAPELGVNKCLEEDQIRKKYNITGCEHCPYFVEVIIKEGEQRPGQKPGWRQYCGKGNFNINRASYVVRKTSHNKNKVVPENHYEWEYAFPNCCPLRKEKI